MITIAHVHAKTTWFYQKWAPWWRTYICCTAGPATTEAAVLTICLWLGWGWEGLNYSPSHLAESLLFWFVFVRKLRSVVNNLRWVNEHPSQRARVHESESIPNPKSRVSGSSFANRTWWSLAKSGSDRIRRRGTNQELWKSPSNNALPHCDPPSRIKLNFTWHTLCANRLAWSFSGKTLTLCANRFACSFSGKTGEVWWDMELGAATIRCAVFSTLLSCGRGRFMGTWVCTWVGTVMYHGECRVGRHVQWLPAIRSGMHCLRRIRDQGSLWMPFSLRIWSEFIQIFSQCPRWNSAMTFAVSEIAITSRAHL